MNNVDVSVSVPNVEGWFGTLNGYAQNAISSASNAAASMTSFAAPLMNSTIGFESVSTSVGIGSATKPLIPTLSLGSRILPSQLEIVAPPAISITGSVPTFTEADPVINIPTLPSSLSVTVPVKDFVVDTSTSFPVAPSTTLPSVPSLLSLNLPTPDAIALPIFDHVFPTSNSLLVPSVTFSFVENAYTDSLLDKVRSELLTRLSGGTGLNPTVEAAIWNRGRDREARASLLAERTLLVDRSAAGFSRPTGAAMAALELVVQETQSKIIDLSRDIMIKQAELEQENIKTSIQQTIALEDILIREHNNVAQRSFEVAKYTQDVAIEIFKVQVNKYNSEVEAYKAYSVAYTSRVQAELAKIEIFKAKIEAEKLKGDINEQNIKIYLAQLEGVKSNVEIYKAVISSVSEKLKAEALKIEIYKSDIEAYTAQVKAKSEEYSMYSEQIKGELAKVSIYESKVKAFASRIEAYATQAEVQVKSTNADISIQELKIKKYEADINAFIKQVQADQLVYQSAVDLYKGQSEMYLADVGLNKASAELALKSAENTITQNKYKSDIGIQNAQINLESLKAAYMGSIEATKAAGTIYSQLSSSALSAINVSASVSGQQQISAQESHSYSGT